MNRLNKIKILPSRNWKLVYNELGSLYKQAFIGSILDHNFPCINSFNQSVLHKILILKIPFRISSVS